jgi:hypothetical protein
MLHAELASRHVCVLPRFGDVHGPGLMKVDREGEPPWGGYVYVDDYAVYVAWDERALAKSILDSARKGS